MIKLLTIQSVQFDRFIEVKKLYNFVALQYFIMFKAMNCITLINELIVICKY